MRCVNHQDIAGIGVCVQCRSVICEACTTRVQGRNFCAACLRPRAPVPNEGGAAGSFAPRLVIAVLTVASVAVLAGVVTGLGFLLHLVT